MRIKPAIIIILCLALLSSAVMGANTHVNITVSETVHQNVTFAENFWLVENQTYLLIQGVINVTNPGDEDIFDIDVEFENVDSLVSDISFDGGRNGSQVRFAGNYSWAEYNEVNVTWQALTNASPFFNDSSPVNVTQDLDEDGSMDYVRVNATHLLFNLSSQTKLVAIRLQNRSLENVRLDSASVTPVNVFLNGTNITLVPYGGDPQIIYGTVYVNGTTNLDNKLLIDMTFNVTDTSYANAMIHIPELRAGQSTRFRYNVSGSVQPPLDIDTNYTHTFNRKVLAGNRFTINDTVANIVDIGENVTGINISIEALNITWDSQDFNFSLHNLSTDPLTDFLNVTEIDNKSWYWEPKGGLLEPNENANITYQVKAPWSVPKSGIYAAVKQTLQYQIAYAASNITVSKVWARASVNFTVSKQIISPSDNLQNKNVTWQSVPTLGARANITFTLQKVSLWVTTTLDPNQDTTGLSKNYTTPVEFNISNPWVAGSASPWEFNFTDGSSYQYPPPIVWIKPYWVITNAYNQILNQSYTRNGTDLYIKYIYVINGYWLEVDKNVSSVGDDRYKINSWVHNRGNGWTPINMTVTVYDFIPDSFNAYNFSISPNNESNVTGEFSGVAYKWDLGLRTPMNSSLAPDDGAVGGQDEWNVTYYVNGTGDYIVSDLYIVGLDPIKVDGASASPLITIITAVKNYSKEVFFAVVVVFLIVLNTVNLLMTNRINKKLDMHQDAADVRKQIDHLRKK